MSCLKVGSGADGRLARELWPGALGDTHGEIRLSVLSPDKGVYLNLLRKRQGLELHPDPFYD